MKKFRSNEELKMRKKKTVAGYLRSMENNLAYTQGLAHLGAYPLFPTTTAKDRSSTICCRKLESPTASHRPESLVTESVGFEKLLKTKPISRFSTIV